MNISSGQSQNFSDGHLEVNNKGSAGGHLHGVVEEDQNRARLYGLLSRVLAAPMSNDTLEIVRGLSSAQVGDESDVLEALGEIGKIAIKTTRVSAEEEYTLLFHGMGSGGEIQPYLSYYLTGFVYEKPLASLRDNLREIGIKASGVSKEPEDHMAFICEVMSGLILGTFHKVASLLEQKQFFQRHLEPWGMRFFKDLEEAKSAKLYKPIGMLGQVFLKIEEEAFSMVNN